ncbi:2OG-Fe dioxygenase family protein [Curvibacter sp. CHRR-16]|uniref:2OG-Fe dioxygenase family protein n=1 Tax=Curvibacter sp. CHRR-16 TaxID=2835872 RepID=UPI001BDA54BD|nr:2OG-Fe dioxygenase family protein [Curvibacter sp. CHRR-16]MBT0571688.1 2OG-Fe dioxygenase family protein [Curvibacter sp. CHRR-16]
MKTFAPPLLPSIDLLVPTMQQQGYAVLSATQVSALSGVEPATLQAWLPYWDDLPPDDYLRDGGRYRRRRHGSFVVAQQQVQPVPHRPHWQPVEYNALHGGISRHFAPLQADLVQHPEWSRLLVSLTQAADQLYGARTWYVEAHQFRIDTTDGIGRPTPEGAHRDGVDMVAVFLLQRHGIKGGETRVFDSLQPAGLRFTLSEPWSLLLLDDAKVVHESTPIQPAELGGFRDTLVITLRRDHFLEA